MAQKKKIKLGTRRGPPPLNRQKKKKKPLPRAKFN